MRPHGALGAQPKLPTAPLGSPLGKAVRGQALAQLPMHRVTFVSASNYRAKPGIACAKLTPQNWPDQRLLT